MSTGLEGSARRPFAVLLIDDVPDLRELYRTALERSGRFVVVGEAGDGAEGLRVARARVPDLILLDLSMPRMGGLEVLPLLRQTVPQAKVVVLSGLDRRHMGDPAAAAGATGYIEKGRGLAELVDELVVVCGALDVVEQVLAEAHTNLEADVRSAGAARRFLDEVLDRWNCATEVEMVKLGISELVANAVVHAKSDVEVTVTLTRTGLRVAVSDRAGGHPQVQLADVDDESGRGLALIEALASRWGVDERPWGKAVWFEVPRLDHVT